MTEQKGLIFRFGEFEVREGEFCLIRGDETIPVEPKAFRVLLYLLRNPQRLVTKDELLDAVWQETAVSENSLTRSVALLRRLLGDDAREPRYIVTVPTVGYRLLCEVDVSGGGETDAAPAPLATSTEQTQPETGSQSGTANQGRRARRSWVGLAWIGAVFVAAIVSVALLRRFEFNRHASQAAEGAAAEVMKVTQLTNLPGWSFGPALSPDGERLAFLWDHAGPKVPNLYVQLIGGSNPIQLTHDHSGYVCCANWSPDGQQIAFGRCDDSGGGVFVVPALGGPERKLTDVVCPYGHAGFPEWTRDGRSMILADRCTPGGVPGIVRFSLETGDKQCLHNPPSGDVGDDEFDLSPDQKTVAFMRNTTAELSEIDSVPTSGGPVRVLVPAENWTKGVMWSPNGDRIIFSSSPTGSMRAWQISPSGGAMKPELEYPNLGSLSRDGRRIAYEGSAGLYGLSDTIWRAQLSGAGGAILSQEITPTSEGQNNGIQLSSDGHQIVYQSAQSGGSQVQTQIWKRDIDGSHPLPLTSFHTGYPGTPRWSPDDRQVVFDYHTSPHGQIYVVDAEGRNQRRITSGDYENVVPSWSRDGNSIYFASNRTGRFQVWKRSVRSGEESQITRNGGFAALESFDGKTLYYSKLEGGGLWSRSDSEERHLTDAPHLGDWGQFAITGDGLYFTDSWTEAGPTLLYYDLRTQHTSLVLVFKESPKPWNANLASTRDGRIVLYVQEERHGSILMAEKTQ
jgi:Tol biopolymer transport system component/DNA-binding winged helix-turn-helix (wHTH) protein